MFEGFVFGVELVEFEFLAALVRHHILKDLVQGDLSCLWITILGDFLGKIAVLPNVAAQRDELHPLIFGGGFPALEVALIEDFNDFLQPGAFFLAAVRSSRIGVLRVELGFTVVQPDRLVEVCSFQPVGLEVD